MWCQFLDIKAYYLSPLTLLAGAESSCLQTARSQHISGYIITMSYIGGLKLLNQHFSLLRVVNSWLLVVGCSVTLIFLMLQAKTQSRFIVSSDMRIIEIINSYYQVPSSTLKQNPTRDGISQAFSLSLLHDIFVSVSYLISFNRMLSCIVGVCICKSIV